MTPAQLKASAYDKLTAIEPGMNRFQWDLRYPDATEVNGFWTPIAAGGLPDDVIGPTVTPGHYSVVLDVGGAQRVAAFDVSLDPGLHATPEDLATRLALQLRIHTTLDNLDKTINAAIAAEDRLKAAISTGHLKSVQAHAMVSTLDREIGELVQLDIHSSEGQLLHEAKLRSHLAYLAADIDLAYDRPTPAQYAVFSALDAQATSGEQKLQATMDEARRLASTSPRPAASTR